LWRCRKCWGGEEEEETGCPSHAVNSYLRSPG
jgi:hypothetical protein